MLGSRVAKRLTYALTAGLLLALGGWTWDHRDYWFANNFRVVESGRIYAGGYQYPTPLKRILERYHIKTVLSLRRIDHEKEADELQVVTTQGARFRRIVIPYRVPDAERLARIEEAVSVLADSENQPIFVHCWAGMHRTGAVVAVYRVGHCGWSEQAARAELQQWGGLTRGEQWPVRMLHDFCTRPGTSPLGQPSSVQSSSLASEDCEPARR
jgi:hypothetical protein